SFGRHQRRRRLDDPCLSAIETPGKVRLLRPAPVIRMAVRVDPLVIGGAEADDDFIAPGPDSVIGRPSSIPSRLAVDGDMFHRLRRVSAGSTARDPRRTEKRKERPFHFLTPSSTARLPRGATFSAN